MLTEERYKCILDALEKDDIVKLKDIIEWTGGSESTIRRDLSALEEGGKLIRVHGGAKRTYNVSYEDRMDDKTVKNVQEKVEIARKAASFVHEEDVIFLDAGSTTFEMIPFLKGKDIIVVTNGVPHASLLTDMQIHTVLLGGKIKMLTKAVIGVECLGQLQNYRFSKAFLGINGIDKQFGYTTPDTEEAEVKKQAVKNAAHTFVIADTSKFNKVSFAKVADIEACSIISYHIPAAIQNKLGNSTTLWEANEK